MKTKFSGILTLFLAFVVQLTFAQEKSISGTISDENGLPLPGVNIVIKGTTSGTQSDFDGNYAISASTGDVISYSFVGYKSVDKTVGAANTISFTMEVDVAAIDEVVITALGIKRKKDEVTTVYQTVSTEELAKANNPSVVNSLSGKVSGLTISQTSNGVSGDSRIVLRGNRSISGNNEALVVIDGAISSTTFLNALDPNQVESLNVIKGAAGSALYGSQGSNGVIVVTTKKSTKGGKMTIQVNSSIDFESVAYVPEKQTRYGQGWDLGNGFENVIYENGAWGPEFDGEMVPVGLPQADGSFVMAPYSSRGSDSMKEFFQTGITRQNSILFSSGDEDGYLTLGARNILNEFIIPGDQRKRNTLTLNTGKTVGNWSVGGNLIYTNTSVERHNGDLNTQLLQSASNIPVTAFENSGNEGNWNAYFTNPYWNLANQRSEGESNNLSLTGDLGYKVNDNISFKLLSNARINTSQSLSYQNGYTEPKEIIDNTGGNRSLISQVDIRNDRSSQYYTDFFMNLDYMLTEKISFGANIGLNNQYFKNAFVRAGGNGLTVDGIYTIPNLSSGPSSELLADNLPRTTDYRSSNSRIGAFANLDFGYEDFLFVTLTGRNDWSSTLNKANQSFFYPSISGSFIPTKAFDNFGGDVLNYMKVTAAYVKIGNDGGVGPYAIQQTYNTAGGFPFNGQNSFVVDQTITDPFLQPEFTTTAEVGLSLGFLKNRVTLDASYSSFNTTDQIVRINTSDASGLANTRINIGETKGYALEFDLGLKVLKSEDFKWDVNVGYSTTDNEVVKVSDQAKQVSLGGYTGRAEVFAIEGEAFPVIQTNSYERDPQGRVIINSAGNPTEAAGLKIAGRTTAKHIVNLNTNFTYKAFTLSATMDYRTGHVFYSHHKENITWSGHAVETAQGGRGAFIWPNSVVETSPGVYATNTSVPSGGTTAGSYINFFGNYRSIGENNIVDATAFKVRELSLSYELDKKFLKNTMITGLRISANARNPFTVLPSENRGYSDPESGFSTGNAQGITEQSALPPTRTFGLGLNLTF
ncbi:SusC/RagA family TonB-linked outer membrane protein [Bizionia gelidisalsuginis]|uniref:SusC/RagA family TonB-linked outer membrane protein n=1 Tax=Bizionia gelidisalsuginis TaxID=291188 RepID=A0ABY3MAS9_9FLAO|nr:SusC/RagA family TonB-linked outer membrane protein [Bizionia gelidisalsuginis]TYC12843.1 SusC/RagA family TonB-linked outer membrane protein [Bizionia gelidisalsuginis]